MLIGIPALIGPDLLWTLRAMGHGDELAVVDANFPAESVARETASGRLHHLGPASTAGAIEAILRLLPIDTFVDRPVTRIAEEGSADHEEPSHLEVRQIIESKEGALTYGVLTRFDFYAAAKRAYAVVQTADQRPYSCFLIKKGVVFADDNRLEV